jgi:hypothetical protein
VPFKGYKADKRKDEVNMSEVCKITITDHEGNVVKEQEAEGYLVCAFSDQKEIVPGITACGKVVIFANNVSDAELAAAMACEETPLGKAHEMLSKMRKKKRRLSWLNKRLGFYKEY